MEYKKLGKITGIIGCILIVVSLFLPWILTKKGNLYATSFGSIPVILSIILILGLITLLIDRESSFILSITIALILIAFSQLLLIELWGFRFGSIETIRRMRDIYLVGDILNKYGSAYDVGYAPKLIFSGAILVFIGNLFKKEFLLSFKRFLKIDWKKISLFLILLFGLTFFINSTLFQELGLRSGEAITKFGFPNIFLYRRCGMAESRYCFPFEFHTVNFIFNIIFWYFISCFIVWIFGGFKNKT